MSNQSQGAGAGGFFPPTSLPSPVPSTASSRSTALLPHPRARSLPSGSTKEATVRRYVEERMAVIARRYVKKFSDPEPSDEVVGYAGFGELCKDLRSIIDVLWLSGTPSLQIPFLLNVASEFTKYIVSFPPSPKATFFILRKLDYCFASLLSGEDIDSKDPLPGFDNGLRAGMSTTDMVRCRSLVEQSRVLVVEVLSSNAEEIEDEDEVEEEEESDLDNKPGGDSVGGPDIGGRSVTWTEDDARLDMDVVRVYEKTIVQLGTRLGDALSGKIQIGTGADNIPQQDS